MYNPPKGHFKKYDYHYLALGDQIEGDIGRRILNPHMIEVTSLEFVDEDWLVDMNLYRRWLKYETDFTRRPAHLR